MKRILSLILSLCMLVSIMPQTAWANTAAERQSYKYNFSYSAFGKSSDIPISTTAAADTAAVGEEGYVADTVFKYFIGIISCNHYNSPVRYQLW